MTVNIIEILKLSDKQLIELSRKNVLSLSLLEMKEIKNYYKKRGRNPTDVELETIAQTWSEHCKHKTLTGIIEYKEKIGGKIKVKTYNNLLKETIFKATKELNKNWCWSVFKDNAGIIEFNEDNGIAFKVETHNHPSALEPYGGAATGIGGVIRDILGVGKGAKPLANTDVFCFGDPELSWKKLPKGVLHPKRIAKGVVSGVRDYGNRMGIPTVNGAVYFDDGYISNPLVYCGTMGIIPKDKISKEVKPGDLVLVVGGRTGRDGIHGATFSSTKLDQESDVSAVQIGNPIVEKKFMDTLLKARDMNLYRAITDCGAGGLSSAVGELGESCGVEVNLELVPLKYKGLKSWEIWVSEAQERMVLAVPPEKKEKIKEVFESENVEAVFIGKFTNNKKLKLFYDKETVAELDMGFLHYGVPKPVRKAVWTEPAEIKKNTKIESKDLGKDLLELLSSLNICSREWIIRQYDHEVQGQTVIKPLHGNTIFNSGPGDAAVIWPYTVTDNSYKGIVLSNGINPEYGKIDTYWMAASAIDEALRNAVCVGGNIKRMALLDNFCWGNPNKEEILGSLVRAAECCYNMSKAYGIPFISGKDSLHNEYSVGNKEYSIPPSLLISAVGVVQDIRKTVTMDLKREGNFIYVVGITKNELGGSQYFRMRKIKGGNVPTVEAEKSRDSMTLLGDAISEGLVESCHDCAEGGLVVALSEMAFAGNKGVEFNLGTVYASKGMTVTEILFSESNGRFIVEVAPENAEKFEVRMEGIPFSRSGAVSESKNVIVKNSEGNKLIKENIDDLRKAWKKTLNW
ncbi:MAG: phosphoribosylformylglycinamidine synthase subunit PurL [Elusimicrobia bacterium]|nr:phosphoribosylformylglycinamidine synthase subunit PurL [Elusimicrobiota bacterium]